MKKELDAKGGKHAMKKYFATTKARSAVLHNPFVSICILLTVGSSVVVNVAAWTHFQQPSISSHCAKTFVPSSSSAASTTSSSISTSSSLALSSIVADAPVINFNSTLPFVDNTLIMTPPPPPVLPTPEIDAAATSPPTEAQEKRKEDFAYEHSWEPSMAMRIQQELEERINNDKNLAKDQALSTTADVKSPYMVALVGIPGSGKSISSLLLANWLEEKVGVKTMIMPHDGYHYSIEEIKKKFSKEQAKDMIYRRGAPDTFDPKTFQRDLERIRFGKSITDEDGHHDSVVTVPGFDHAKGDPEPNQHVFDRSQHQVVLCEGLYLLHDGDGWEDIANFFDLKISINSDVDQCVERLKIRNLVIPGYTPEEIEIRCEVVDRVNAMTVLQSRHRADVTVDAYSLKK